MFITRDIMGKGVSIKIELTSEEIRRAHEEYARVCRIEDIEHCLDENGVRREDITEDLLERCQLAFDKRLTSGDRYNEAYWDVLDSVLSDLGIIE